MSTDVHSFQYETLYSLHVAVRPKLYHRNQILRLGLCLFIPLMELNEWE